MKADAVGSPRRPALHVGPERRDHGAVGAARAERPARGPSERVA